MQTNTANSAGLLLALDRAEQLISTADGGQSSPAVDVFVDESTDDSSDAAGDQACHSLVEAGFFALNQLEVLLGFTDTPVARLQLIPELIDRASSYGTASPAAVGAAAALVGVVRGDDVIELVETIESARHAFGDEEFGRGVAAFIASLTEQIALSVAIDPVLVHGELRRGLPRTQSARRTHVRTSVHQPRRANCTRGRRRSVRLPMRPTLS